MLALVVCNVGCYIAVKDESASKAALLPTVTVTVCRCCHSGTWSTTSQDYRKIASTTKTIFCGRKGTAEGQVYQGVDGPVDARCAAITRWLRPPVPN